MDCKTNDYEKPDTTDMSDLETEEPAEKRTRIRNINSRTNG